MISLCESEARQPVENLINYPNNVINNEELRRAYQYAILAEEYRRQLADLLSSG